MSYTNSSLISKTQLTTKCNPRKYPITKITIHHAAGVLSMETLLNYLATTSRNVSANYVLSQGKLGLNVEEKNRAWTSSNSENDHKAVTIEVGNSQSGGNWPVSDVDLALLIKWAADVCKRNGIPKLYYDGTPNGTLTLHEMFAATGCPGPYLKSKIPYICDEVNKLINGKEVEIKPPSTTQTIFIVTELWGYTTAANAVNDVNRVRKVIPGKYYIYNQTADAINVTMNATSPGAWINKHLNDVFNPTPAPVEKKTLEQVAKEVIQGQWGNGATRTNSLTAAGYIAANVQAAVNAILAKKTVPNLPLQASVTTSKKTNEQIAKEIVQGLWGNGSDRKSRITAAGYNYSDIQAIVNKLL